MDADGNLVTKVIDTTPGRMKIAALFWILKAAAYLAAAEKAAGKPSKNGRALFRLLRQAFEAEPEGD